MADGVIASAPLGHGPLRFARLEGSEADAALAEANRSARQWSAEVLSGLLGPPGVEPLLDPGEDTCRHWSPGPEEVRPLLTEVGFDRLIARHTLPPDGVGGDGRPKLARDGEVVDLASFTRLDARTGQRRLDPYAVGAGLRSGASLYLYDVGDDHPPAGRLVEHLRRVMGGSGHAGVFASHGASDGSPFGAHWDTTENLSFQIEGRRHWSVWRPSIPDNHPGFQLGRGEPGELVWEGEIGPGEVLAVPRSFWHEVRPVGEGLSVQLAAGVNRPVAHDAARWLLPLLAERTAARRPLPVDPDELTDVALEPLRTTVGGVEAEHFAAHLHARELPATAGGVRMTDAVGLAGPDQLWVRRGLTGDVVVVDDPSADQPSTGHEVWAGGGREVSVPADLVASVAAVLSGPPQPIAALVAAHGERVVAAVDHLLRIGWCTLSRPDEDPLAGDGDL